MENSPINEKKLADALRRSSGGKISGADISAAQNGDPTALLSQLSEKDRRRIERLLGDKTALRKLLSDAATRDLLKELSDHG